MTGQTIAVVGSKGVVGTALTEFLRCHDHRVLPVDRDTVLTLEAVREADVVFIATLPIEEVAELIWQTACLMKPGSLLIHCTSIEQPSPNQIAVTDVIERSIALAHLHFHFRPEVPLDRVLFGQNVSISLQGKEQEKWKQWLEQLIRPYGPILYHFEPGEHDQVTTVSQLVHMITSLLVGTIWRTLSPATVDQGVRIGGPPSTSLIRSVVRSSSGGKVLASILANHPATERILDIIGASVVGISRAVADHDTDTLEQILEELRLRLDPAVLSEIEQATAQMARLEADMRQTHFTFCFSPERNQVGLLAKVLGEFDQRGVDKTTTIAQVDKDGGCTIMIGVRELNDAAKEAEQIITSWEGCLPG